MGILVYMLTGKVTGHVPDQKAIVESRRVASEGMVLLKNEGALPIKDKRIAVFGAGAIDTFICGTGSGHAFSPYKVNVVDGLRNGGFEITSNLYLKNYKKKKKTAEKNSPKISLMSKRFSGIEFVYNDEVFEESEIKDASSSKSCIYCIHRNAGEGGDRKAIKGDYYLSDNEIKNIENLGKAFDKLIVVLNTCVVDATYLKNSKYVSGLILMGQSGLEAGNALSDIIKGEVSPSGRLVDTWAEKYEDYPASKTFSSNDKDTHSETYSEGIYVGYRYFDSFKKEVTYPFGYGMSYTTFSFENVKTEYKDEKIKVSLDVVNEGDVSSKEVVQIYVSSPNGKLRKPFQELKGFEKTGIIKPNEKENVVIEISLRDLASYDEEKSSYVLEEGDYLIRLGENSRSTSIIAKVNMDKTTEIVKLAREFEGSGKIEELDAGKFDFEKSDCETIHIHSDEIKTIDESSKIKKEITTYIAKDSNYEKIGNKGFFPINLDETLVEVDSKSKSTLLDVKEGKVKMEEFIASLDYETLLRICTGTSSETIHEIENRTGLKLKPIKVPVTATGKLTGQYQNSLLIPPMCYCDGPAGLHMMGFSSTTFPTGMALSHTWDKDAALAIGDCFGIEMDAYDLDVILGPGMNIHRDPLCGRNFEYYSEDPLVTGKIASGFIRGCQENHPKRSVTPKHFCVNNQEDDRTTSNSIVSERTLREIYLKGFEIAVKEGHPNTIMSSYNLLNGIHTSSRYDLLTDVLRGEWGFSGYVMTDWDGTSNRVEDLFAGNDIIMGGYQTDLISCAISGVGPVFENDGSVKTVSQNAYGGFFKKVTTYWNSFKPGKDGKDTVSTRVEKDIEVGDAVKNAVKEGYASVEENKDGSRTVTYKGTKMGSYLPLGALQRNAMRILSLTMTTSKMDELIRQVESKK